MESMKQLEKDRDRIQVQVSQTKGALSILIGDKKGIEKKFEAAKIEGSSLLSRVAS